MSKDENGDECRYEGVGRVGARSPAVGSSADVSGGVTVTFAPWGKFPYALRRSVTALRWTLQWPGQSTPTEFDLLVRTPEQVTALRLLLHRVQEEMTVAGLWPSNPDELDMTRRVRASLRDVGNPLDEVDDAGERGPELALAIPPIGDAATPLLANGAHISRAARPASFEEVRDD